MLVWLVAVEQYAFADLVLVGPNEKFALSGVVNDRMTNQGTIIAAHGTEPLRLTGLVDGSGSYEGDVTFGGDFQPGNSPAIVNFQNNLSLTLHNQLTIEIGGTTPGTEHDQLNIGGLFSPGGTLDVVLIDVGAGIFSPQSGDSFQLFTWGSLDGLFNDVSLPDLEPGLAWNDSQLYIDGTVSVVPEPSWIGPLAILLACKFGRKT